MTETVEPILDLGEKVVNRLVPEPPKPDTTELDKQRELLEEQRELEDNRRIALQAAQTARLRARSGGAFGRRLLLGTRTPRGGVAGASGRSQSAAPRLTPSTAARTTTGSGQPRVTQ